MPTPFYAPSHDWPPDAAALLTQAVKLLTPAEQAVITANAQAIAERGRGHALSEGNALVVLYQLGRYLREHQ